MSEPSELTFTGERFLPNEAGEMWAEHWHRYHYIAPLTTAKRVLDVACGEGYGSALLARSAATVEGADISAEAIKHAKKAYSTYQNLAFTQANCTRLPFADQSFDVVVSFETIEHLAEHVAFLVEIKRVLTQDGLLILADELTTVANEPEVEPFSLHPPPFFLHFPAFILHPFNDDSEAVDAAVV